MLTIKTFAMVASAIVGVIALFALSIVVFGKTGFIIAVASLLILLACFLYANARMDDIEKLEEAQEEQVKRDYSYVKRAIDGRRGYY